ncbi:alpha/beta hydrolase [Nocardioides marmoraquaticus]
MSVVIPAPPVEVPECEVKASGRGFVTGIRAAAVGASDAGDVMRDNAAPAEWEGDAAEVANHAMTSTADDLEGAVAAMQDVVTAGDTFFDTLDGLLDRRQSLVTRRTYLVSDRLDLSQRAESYDIATEEAGLEQEAEALRRRIVDFDDDVTTWGDDLTTAEDAFIAVLRANDTVAEGATAAESAPDTGRLAQQLSERAGDPEAMNRWWESLTPAQQEALKISHPDLVGGGNGIPAVERDDANRANLSEDLNTLLQKQEDGELTDEEQERLDRLEHLYGALGTAGEGDEPVLDPATMEPLQPLLMIYDPDAAAGDGMAALSWGNPDTADNVSVNVPGLTSTMDNFQGVTGDALNVYREAVEQGNGSVASIAWLGYDAPSPDGILEGPLDTIHGIEDVAQVAEEDYARAGAANLSDFIDGLRASDQGGQAHLTAIGHSYGSTTVAIASGDGIPVDNTVLVGSPGAGGGNEHASDLSGDVYVGSAQDDFVTRLGNPTMAGLGDDPAESDFGAHRFQVDNATDEVFTSLDNHTSYFDPGSTSLDNIGRIVAGEGDQVEQVDGRSDSETPLWWADQTVGEGVRWVEEQGQRIEDEVEGRLEDAGEAVVEAGGRLWPF